MTAPLSPKVVIGDDREPGYAGEFGVWICPCLVDD